MAEIKEDFLEVDSKIPGQNYVCLSFVSPEKMLKQKEVFFATKFLDYIINNPEQDVQEIRKKMLSKGETTTSTSLEYEDVKKLYEDWKYLKNEDIEHDFFELNDYKTSMRGLKVRGTYDSHKEASVRAQVLRRKDPSFNVFVGQVGYWLPWDPECEAVKEQEYQEGQLNDLVKKYKENADNKDTMYEQMKSERIEKAKKEINAKKELLKAQNEVVSPEEAVKNIEQLRGIVDESDKLFYDNLKKESESTVSEPLSEPLSEPVSEPVSEVSSQLESLEASDPWLNRMNSV